MPFLSRLFGPKSPAAGPAAAASSSAVLHKDCRIYPQPIKEAGGYRVAARIEKDFGDVVKTHRFIRSDVHSSLETATEASVDKARIAIDQLGDGLFA